MATIDVVQVSDLHVNDGSDLFGQNPRAAVEALLADITARDLGADLVVATGDLAHDGDPDAYEWLADRFVALGVPVAAIPGNHDDADAFRRHLPRAGVDLPQVLDLGDWRFVFLDSNAAEPDTPPGPDGRRHGARIGALRDADAVALVAAIEEADAHVMVWTHHPPLAHPRFEGLAGAGYAPWLRERLTRSGAVRGLSGGHVHSEFATELDGVRYFTCPSVWLSLDLDAGTLAPPGYRHFRFHTDGRIDARTHWIDTGRTEPWPPYPDWVPKVLAEGG